MEHLADLSILCDSHVRGVGLEERRNDWLMGLRECLFGAECLEKNQCMGFELSDMINTETFGSRKEQPWRNCTCLQVQGIETHPGELQD